MTVWSALRIGAASALLAIAAAAGVAHGKGDFADVKPIPVVVMLGDKDNKLVFMPNTLRFETGKLYKLLLVNDSPQKHEFVAAELTDSVFTIKAEVVTKEGEEIAEICGIIREIEMAPGVTVEWYFVPLRTVKQAAFICDQPGHLAAGMKGTFKIE
jgi:uncharacterized cupredoxin-like copper-binding protein